MGPRHMTHLAAIAALLVLGQTPTPGADAERAACELAKKLGGSLSHINNIYNIYLDHCSFDSSQFSSLLISDNFGSLVLHDSSADDACMEKIADLASIRNLTIGSTRVTDRGLLRILGHPELTCLYASGTAIGDESLSHIDSLKNLLNLDVGGTLVTDKSMPAIATLDKLYELSMSDTAITDDGIEALRGLKKLGALELARNAIGNRAVARIATFKRLDQLDLAGTKIDDDGAKLLSGLRRLEQLNLSGTRVADDGLAGLARLKKLNALRLRDTGVAGPGLEFVADLPKLGLIDLAGTKIGDDAGPILARCGGLGWLDLSGTRFGDAGLTALAGGNRPRLRTLLLGGSAVTDKGLAVLADATVFEDLSMLDIAGTAVADAGFGHLEGRFFDRINACGTRITDRVAPALGAIGVVRELDLSATDFGDEGLIQFRPAYRLQTIHLAHTGITLATGGRLGHLKAIEHWDLAHSRVSDVGLGDLVGDVLSLDLDGTGITDEGMRRLAATPRRVLSLRLYGTAVTAPAVEALAATASLYFEAESDDFHLVYRNGARTMPERR